MSAEPRYNSSGLPLNGVRVVDFTRVLSGPYGALILADLGAEVIKVEAPGLGDPSRANAPKIGGESHYFMALNRGKKSVVLNLTSDAGRDAALALCARADVVLENFRPGVMERLGLSVDTVRSLNPRVIYCSISGYGQTGPMAQKPAYNEVIQAMTGIMSLNGDVEGSPVKVGLPIGDLGGGIFAVIGVLSALERRHRSGRGEYIDVSLFDVSVSMLSYLAALYLTTGEPPERVGSGHHSVAPLGVYGTTDGYLAVSVFTRKFWINFCSAIEREDLLVDERFRSNSGRVRYKRELDEIIKETIGARNTAYWEDVLTKADVPHSKVADVGASLESELARERDMVIVLDHPTAGSVRSVGSVLQFGGGPKQNRMVPAPLLGEHTAEVLQEVAGYSEEQINELLQAGVVGAGAPHSPPGNLRVQAIPRESVPRQRRT